MPEDWERVYAKFFYALVVVVIAVVIAYIVITDFHFAIALLVISGASLALPRLVPARIRAALGRWAFKNRLNVFLYFSATGALVCMAQYLIRRHIDWGYIVTFVVVMPALYTVFFKDSSAGSTTD